VIGAEKPKQLRKGARREAILDVAAPAFLEHGYARISLSAIAAQVGGSKATMWRHFPSKADLFAAVLERQTESFRESLDAVLRQRRTLRETLRDFCVAYMVKLNSEEAIALHRLVIAEAARFPEIGEIFYRQGPALVNRLLTEAIAEACRRGDLGPCDAEAAARYITSMCLSGRFQHMLYGIGNHESDEDHFHEAERIVDFFMKGLGADPA
jgi:AcrR family transcriptional regulator